MINKVAVVFVSGGLYPPKVIEDELFRVISSRGYSISSIYYLKEYDDNLPLLLPTVISNEQTKNIVIVAFGRAFALVSRVLATLQSDNLLADGDILHPMASAMVKSGSYLYRVGDSNINVLDIENTQIPNLLFEREFYKSVHIFTKDPNQQIELHKEISLYSDICHYQQITPTWYKYTITDPSYLKSLPPPLLHQYHIETDIIFEAIVAYLIEEAKSITFAESCTGGLLCADFTSVSGASNVLKGSFVTYSNEIKESWLGVKKETLIEYGAVSSECVTEMATGAKNRVGSDIAIAISGIAGPTGAVEGKPVGTVYIAVSNSEGTISKRLQLKGDRVAIQKQSVYGAIELFLWSEKKILKILQKSSKST